MQINNYISWEFTRNHDKGFCIGVDPIWIHHHYGKSKYHFHFLINLGFWFWELQIGDDWPKEDRIQDCIDTLESEVSNGRRAQARREYKRLTGKEYEADNKI